MRTTSPAGRAFIERAETFSARVYLDRGKPAIGFGHDMRPGESFPNGITRAQGDAIMSNDLRIAESGVNSLVSVEVPQGVYDALVDVSYECGAGCLHGTQCLARLNAGDFAGARAELLGFDHVVDADGTKHVDAGVAARRVAAALQLWDRVDVAA